MHTKIEIENALNDVKKFFAIFQTLDITKNITDTFPELKDAIINKLLSHQRFIHQLTLPYKNNPYSFLSDFVGKFPHHREVLFNTITKLDSNEDEIFEKHLPSLFQLFIPHTTSFSKTQNFLSEDEAKK